MSMCFKPEGNTEGCCSDNIEHQEPLERAWKLRVLAQGHSHLSLMQVAAQPVA